MMTFTVQLLVLTLVTQCWSAPQRRNWTPQAILYLKGAQGHRSVLERASREEGDAAAVRQRWSSNGLLSSFSPLLLELLQQTVEDGGGPNPDKHPDEDELSWTYF